jgi:multidrug efflux pump
VNITAFFIKRPAFTIVVSLLLTMLGFLAYLNCPIRWVPNVSSPQVTIFTAYTGADGRLVEHDVTKVIEDSLAGIDGIDSIESVSRMGSSQISVNFKLGTNMEAAVENIRSHLDSVRGNLPTDVLPPSILKMNPNDMPIMYISFYDNHRSEREMSDYADQILKPAFDTLDGVANVQVMGERLSAMRVFLDPEKMAAASVTADDVTTLIHDQNVSVASGQIKTPDRYYSIYTDTTLKNADQFNELILRDNQNQVVRLKDVGHAQVDTLSTDDYFRVQGKPALAFGIIAQSTANPLDVEKNVKKALTELQRTLPEGMHASILWNQADYIRASINSVYESFVEALFFVWLVIFAFLCSFRATLIPMITIPVCVIATFSIIAYFGFSINTITLMAFVLAIGLVVDDAIVMLENINRYREAGLNTMQAALKGAREMVFPIIAMTLTLAAVYAPIAYTPGLLGVLFKEFTFTLAGAVIISGVVALTLTPMMCARVLRDGDTHARYQAWFQAHFEKLQRHYARLLQFTLAHRPRLLLVMVCLVGLGIGLAHVIPSELAPQEEMNEIDVYMGAPRSASLDYTNRYAQQAEAMYANNPDIAGYFSEVGGDTSNHAFEMLTLKPSGERHHSTEELMASLTQQLSNIPGVEANVTTPMPALAQLASGDDGDRLGLVLMTTGDYLPLQQATQKIMATLRQNPGFAHVQNRLRWDSEQFQVNVNRDRAADLKVSLPAITNTLSIMLAGRDVGKMDEAYINVQMKPESLANPNIIQQLYVRNTANEVVPLSQLVSVSSVSSPEVFLHDNRLRSDVIYVTLAPNYKLADAIKAMEAAAKANLPDNVKYTFMGEAKNYLEAAGKTITTFGLALLFIYLVLVAQFESFIDPFIILFTVPLAVVGALLVLWAFGGTLNIYSNIGLITLIGLIAKHGILITDFANTARAQGKTVYEAATQAAQLRLRPILMTTAAMILGALPLAFAMGPGAEARQQVGLVIVGGLFFGTFFSLIVIPVMYTYLSPFKRMPTLTSEPENGLSL